MIAVIGPNPAIDLILEVPAIRLGTAMRAQRSLHIAGGKPVNVARVLRRLDVSTSLVVPLGGPGGQVIREACDELGIGLQALPIRGITRTCVIVVDLSTVSDTVVNEPGPMHGPDEAAVYVSMTEKAIQPGGLVLASGSLPPGLPSNFYAGMVDHARRVGAHLIVDTSGIPLREALTARPWAIKINADELQAVMGESPERGAITLLRQNVEHVVVTRGAHGATYYNGSQVVTVGAADVPTVNSTGAGDAFLAGLACALDRRHNWIHAVHFASAVAGLVASTFGPDPGPAPDVAAVLRTVQGG